MFMFSIDFIRLQVETQKAPQTRDLVYMYVRQTKKFLVNITM